MTAYDSYSVQRERARQGRTFFIEERLHQGAVIPKELTAPAEGFLNLPLGMAYCTKNAVTLTGPRCFDEVHGRVDMRLRHCRTRRCLCHPATTRRGVRKSALAHCVVQPLRWIQVAGVNPRRQQVSALMDGAPLVAEDNRCRRTCNVAAGAIQSWVELHDFVRQRTEGGAPTLFERESGERLCKCLNYGRNKWESAVTPRRLFLKLKPQTL